MRITESEGGGGGTGRKDLVEEPALFGCDGEILGVGAELVGRSLHRTRQFTSITSPAKASVTVDCDCDRAMIYVLMLVSLLLASGQVTSRTRSPHASSGLVACHATPRNIEHSPLAPPWLHSSNVQRPTTRRFVICPKSSQDMSLTVCFSVPSANAM